MTDAAERHWHPPGPKARAFMRSKAFICGLKGPFGSGKSVTCTIKLAKNAQGQPVSPIDGVARRRTAIIRNTYPELSTTTVKTWHQWFPQECGAWRDKGPPRHLIRRFDKDGKLVFEWEVLFLALDDLSDVAHVLSLELSDAWINEAREVPKAILDGLTGRVGRFPSKEHGGCHSPQILMDTNPPDTDHWWYILAERAADTQTGREVLESMEQSERELRDLGYLAPDQKLFEFFSQPGGLEPDAENIQNLSDGRAYYVRLKAGKTEEWIKVYVNAEYGFVQDGKPVINNYRDGIHCKEFELVRGLPIDIGLDFGLTPAAVFGQRLPNGRWLNSHELATERSGIAAFGDMLNAFIQRTFGAAVQIASITGDPSGTAGQPGHDSAASCFDILKARKINAQPASTNEFTMRVEVVTGAFAKLIDGEPGKIIHPRCTVLRKGYQGGYAYKRVQGAGQDSFRDKPDKNKYSHPCEADQYMMLGGGEERVLLRGDATMRQTRAPPRFAITD